MRDMCNKLSLDAYPSPAQKVKQFHVGACIYKTSSHEPAHSGNLAVNKAWLDHIRLFFMLWRTTPAWQWSGREPTTTHTCWVHNRWWWNWLGRQLLYMNEKKNKRKMLKSEISTAALVWDSLCVWLHLLMYGILLGGAKDTQEGTQPAKQSPPQGHPSPSRRRKKKLNLHQ